jgi:hypothetical protein
MRSAFSIVAAIIAERVVIRVAHPEIKSSGPALADDP